MNPLMTLMLRPVAHASTRVSSLWPSLRSSSCSLFIVDSAELADGISMVADVGDRGREKSSVLTGVIRLYMRQRRVGTGRHHGL